ncbi:Rpn family recombination-promoting nuclease/putative transposase [Sulfurihydrogenibium sp.]|uniref:Rpn family recombination-promoting nuclease/putative transposase n=1 Tax=Sulfurihydrogenibium sp. TaxID=2053621 RepID=UPI0026273C2F|nr:Rpn family recombination-promoting nuclease/putative transposase [Sulfurihydrogenibium sp.]
MSIEKNPHDWVFKNVFSKFDNVSSFLSIFLPDLYKLIVPKSMKILNPKKQTKEYRKYFLDVGVECKIKTKNHSHKKAHLWLKKI